METGDAHPGVPRYVLYPERSVEVVAQQTPQTGPGLVVNPNSDPANAGEGAGGCTDFDCTLREALTQANGDAVADEITFDLPQGQRTITLKGGQLQATTGTTTIDGADQITVDGNDASRILEVQGGNLTLRGLTLTNGNAGGSSGGALRVNPGATATVESSTITANSALSGGGIYSDGTLTLTSSTTSNNSADNSGGGIFSATPDYSASTTPPAVRTTITNSTISGNSADTRGSGVFNNNGYTEIGYSTIANNSSTNASFEGVESFGDSTTGTRLTANVIAGNTAASQPRDVGNFSGDRPYESGGYNVAGVVTGDRTGELGAQGRHNRTDGDASLRHANADPRRTTAAPPGQSQQNPARWR